MTIEVNFVKSSDHIKGCPEGKLPEFAFIGRSNVGKSSLINLLANNHKLAKTSSRPGKTQLINHFEVLEVTKQANGEIIKNKKWFLVDLPGYGYARASKTSKASFEELIKSYIATRQNLCCLFVLIDSRLEPQNNDIEFINILGQLGVPFVLVFTKIDKISANKTHSNIQKFKKTLLLNWDELPEIFQTSSVNKTGAKEILDFIEKAIKLNVDKK